MDSPDVLRTNNNKPNKKKKRLVDVQQEKEVDGKSIIYFIIRKVFDSRVIHWNLISQLGWYLVLVASIIYFIIRKVFDSVLLTGI